MRVERAIPTHLLRPYGPIAYLIRKLSLLAAARKIVFSGSQCGLIPYDPILTHLVDTSGGSISSAIRLTDFFQFWISNYAFLYPSVFSFLAPLTDCEGIEMILHYFGETFEAWPMAAYR